MCQVLQKNKHITSIVTFDQPLYWKAKTIVAGEPEGSGMQSNVVRLEGFYTEISLLYRRIYKKADGQLWSLRITSFCLCSKHGHVQ